MTDGIPVALLLARKRRFLPTQIPGLVAWFDASSGMFQDSAGTTPAAADADPVGKWTDQSGQGNHATQGTTGNKPQLKLAIQNGKPTVRFTTDDYLNANGIATTFTGSDKALTRCLLSKSTTSPPPPRWCSRCQERPAQRRVTRWR
jgi:hypothetical protein